MRYYMLLAAILLSIATRAQTPRDTPTYEKHPDLPAFYILALDSSDAFNTYYLPTGKPTVFFYFSPDCDHCQKEIGELTGIMDSLGDAQVYLLSFAPLAEIRKFAAERRLEQYKNLHLGKDHTYFFPSFYETRFVPFVVVYDKQKKLVAAREGGFKMPELIETVRRAGQ